MTEVMGDDNAGTALVLTLAQDEARRLNHPYIGTEHLVLGLVREDRGPAGRVLGEMHVNLDDLRRRIEERVGRGSVPVEGDISLTPRIQKVVDLSRDQARLHHRRGADSGDLLLALIDDGGGIASRLFSDLGVDVNEVQRRLGDTPTG
jgi:ATP-dependent Clp protease ATP-binding subunit ClpC